MTAVGSERCPCGGVSYAACCGPLHAGTRTAAKAEQVMRARYSAFVRHDAAYLLSTWHPHTRPTRVRFDADRRWTRLAVLDTIGGDLLDADGVVAFEAHHERRGEHGGLRERSYFQRVDNCWVYVGPAQDR